MSKNIEKTAVVLKPDSVQRDIVGRIITTFEEKGFKIAGLKMFVMNMKIFEVLYEDIRDQPYYQQTQEYLLSGPCVAIVLEGLDAVERIKSICGCSDLSMVEGWTIRGRYALWTGCDVIHRSDDIEHANKAIDLIFDQHEIIEYRKYNEHFMSETAWNGKTQEEP